MTTLIAMPRFAGAPRGWFGRGQAHGLALVGWYVGCITIGSGCLYLGPVVIMNQPPKILQPELLPGEELLVPLAPTTQLTFVGQDPDSAELTCYWVLDDQPPVLQDCQRQGTSAFSTFLVPFDPGLDGAAVQGHLVDSDPAGSGEDVLVPYRLYLEGGEL